MKKIFAFLLYSFTIFSQQLPYKNPNLSIEERVRDLLSRLTLKEKIELLGGTGFATKPIERLGIPELRMTDGPVGVRWGESTAFPVSIAMAATWDPSLIYSLGTALGRETKGKARHVILGPCVNIARIPMGGRNFESFGEDPYLASRMAVNYIKGVQSEGVAATVKHFAVNNQEHERTYIDVLVSLRALNEIYLPAFKAAVTKADVLCVMSAYNKVNNHFASENEYLLQTKLKDEWNFKGLVMSDWGAVHSVVPTLKGGLDLEMPYGTFLNYDNVIKAIEKNIINLSTIDKKVERILTIIIKLGLLDTAEWKENSVLINSAENQKIAYEVSKASIVLLKNKDSILPINEEKVKKIAVIGPAAKIARTGGGGSSLVSAINPVSPYDGLKNKIDPKILLEFAEGVQLDGDAKSIPSDFLFADNELKQHGLVGEYYSNKTLSGKPVLSRIDKEINFWWHGESPSKEINEDNFSIRWSGYLVPKISGQYEISIATDDGIRLYVDDKLLIDDWFDRGVSSSNVKLLLEKNKPYRIKIEYYENAGDAVCVLGWNTPGENIMESAIEIAKRSELVILFVGTSYNIETEGRDRENLLLPNDQVELINKVARVNKNVVVVLNSGSPVLMNDWIDNVPVVLQMWFGGSQGGNAIADVLLGNYNPSGKLPITFPRLWEDCSAFGTYKSFPSRTYYSDDIYVGYRHFDKSEIEPLFPFGFGLSYTSFDYNDVSLETNNEEYTLTFFIKNTGQMDGFETPQLYVGKKFSKIDRPVKELKSFSKVFLKTGETKKVVLSVPKKNLAYFDIKTDSWLIEEGVYEFMVGASSRDIRLKKEVIIN